MNGFQWSDNISGNARFAEGLAITLGVLSMGVNPSVSTIVKLCAIGGTSCSVEVRSGSVEADLFLPLTDVDVIGV